MSNPNYYLLGNTLVVSIQGGKTYTISTEDYRFSLAKDAIEKEKFEELLTVLDPTASLDKEGFSVRDGLVYFKEEPIPTILGNKFLEFKINKVSFLGLVNFWLNLKSRLNFENSKEVIIRLLSQEAYPVTSDGFYVVYKGDFRDPINSGTAAFFYNYNHGNNGFKDYFDQKMMLEDIISDVFGFNSKKLNKIVLQQMFRSNQVNLNTNVFSYGLTFKGILSPNNLYLLMEKDALNSLNDNVCQHSKEQFIQLNKFLKEISKTKNENEVSEKKIMNIFQKGYNLNDLFNCANLFGELKRYNVTLDLENNKLTAVDEYIKYMQRELDKMKNPEYPLHQEKNFPAILKLQDLIIGDLKFILPQTNHDLTEWSRKMSNCIHGYGEKAIKGQSLVVAIVSSSDPDKMLYNIEITDQRIYQFKAKSNRSADKNHYKEVEQVLYSCGLIKEKTLKDS